MGLQRRGGLVLKKSSGLLGAGSAKEQNNVNEMNKDFYQGK